MCEKDAQRFVFERKEREVSAKEQLISIDYMIVLGWFHFFVTLRMDSKSCSKLSITT